MPHWVPLGPWSEFLGASSHFKTPLHEWGHYIGDLNLFNMNVTCEVLVYLGENARPVAFVGGKNELLAAIKDSFSDVLSLQSELQLQVK